MLDTALEKFIRENPECSMAQIAVNSLDYRIAALIFEEMEKNNYKELFTKLINGAVGVVISLTVSTKNKIGILEFAKDHFEDVIKQLEETGTYE